MHRLASIFAALLLSAGCSQPTAVSTDLTRTEQEQIKELDRKVEEGERRAGGASYDFGVKELDRKIEEAERKNTPRPAPAAHR